MIHGQATPSDFPGDLARHVRVLIPISGDGLLVNAAFLAVIEPPVHVLVGLTVHQNPRTSAEFEQ